MFVFMVMVLVCFKEQYFGCLGGKNYLKVGIIFIYKVIQIFLWIIDGWKFERCDLNVKS